MRNRLMEPLNFKVTDEVDTPDRVRAPVWTSFPRLQATVGQLFTFKFSDYAYGGNEFYVRRGTGNRERSDGTLRYTPTRKEILTWEMRVVNSETGVLADQTLRVEVLDP
jgi:hypothetical protein